MSPSLSCLSIHRCPSCLSLALSVNKQNRCTLHFKDLSSLFLSLRSVSCNSHLCLTFFFRVFCAAASVYVSPVYLFRSLFKFSVSLVLSQGSQYLWHIIFFSFCVLLFLLCLSQCLSNILFSASMCPCFCLRFLQFLCHILYAVQSALHFLFFLSHIPVSHSLFGFSVPLLLFLLSPKQSAPHSFFCFWVPLHFLCLCLPQYLPRVLFVSVPCFYFCLSQYISVSHSLFRFSVPLHLSLSDFRYLSLRFNVALLCLCVSQYLSHILFSGSLCSHFCLCVSKSLSLIFCDASPFFQLSSI
jgi:hypothetical protein